MSKDLYIFVHLLKTGGMSFRKPLELNIDKKERLGLFIKSGVYKKDFDRRKHFMEMLEDKLSKMNDMEKNRVKFLYGHGVPYGVHSYFERPFKYIIFFRDPIKRAISFYNFYLARYLKKFKTEEDVDDYDTNLLVNGKIPEFYDWVKEKYGSTEAKTETMYQHLKIMGFIEGTSESDIKNMLDKFYFVGIVEHLDTDINYLCGEFGFNKFLVKQNISKKFVKDIKDKETLRLLKEKNKNDIKLYKYAVKKREKFVKSNKNYYKLARKAQIKKKILLPFTQVIFDPKGTLIELSSYLKRKSRLYEKLFDFIRGYEPLDDVRKK